MFSITCPWLSSHHVTLSRRLREPSIELGLNKLIVKFPGLSNQYVQLHTSQNTRRIRNENKRTAAARRCGTEVGGAFVQQTSVDLRWVTKLNTYGKVLLLINIIFVNSNGQ